MKHFLAALFVSLLYIAVAHLVAWLLSWDADRALLGMVCYLAASAQVKHWP